MNRDAETVGRDREREKRERDSSRDSKDSGREVRCGCQYYQSDSLLPDRQSLVGTKPISRPSSRQSNYEAGVASAKMGDHEYEPITPMAPPQKAPTPPPVEEIKEVLEEKPKKKKGRSSKIQYIDNDPNYIFIPLHGSTDEENEVEVDKHYLRIPKDEELIIHPQDVDADADGEDNQDDDNEELSVHQFQKRIEERFFSPTPTTTESRTDGEFNTSQIDSSGLEDLPLKRDARKSAAAEDASGRTFQQKFRTQANRIRTKIRNIQKPKINLPDKSKFNLPERPKFKMPERPKINFPERPKFNFPERPKFNMPQRPKISMPNFQLNKSKSSSLRRPLRDRNQQQSSSQSTVGSKKNIFDSLNFRTYPRFFNKKKRLAEQNVKTRGKRAMTPPPRMETDSIPSTPESRKVPYQQKWTQRYKDIKFADDENQSNQSEKRSASIKAMSSFDDDEPIEDDSTPFRDPDCGHSFRDTDFGNDLLNVEAKKKLKGRSSNSLMDSDKEQRSSGSSSERHRVGVLEEIDSDEFFLREKGLSREDVDLSRFLSDEIRDAFRSPKNALANLDAEFYNDEDDLEIREINKHAECKTSLADREKNQTNEMETEDLEPNVQPIKPSRSRSLKSRRSIQSKSSLNKMSSKTSLDTRDDSNFNTFPPSRPSRSSKQSMQSLIADKQSIGTNDLDFEAKEGFTEYEVRLDVRVPSLRSLDENDAGKLISGRESMNELWTQENEPPLPPKRRKSTKDLSERDNDSMVDEVCQQEKWMDEVNMQAMVPGDVTALHMEPVTATVTPLQHGLYDLPPQAPIRKTRSRGTSLADEDRTSRGAESLVSEAQSYPAEDITPVEVNKQDDADNFGYAIVSKPEKKTIGKPPRQKQIKPPRPPPISRKKRATDQMMNLKNQGINFFFTYPRRAMKSLHKSRPPIRPVRNYSTIGSTQTLPSRPPRRTRVFREPVYADDNIPFMDESEKETLDSSTPKVNITEIEVKEEQELKQDNHQIGNRETSSSNDDAKDLKSGEVVEKMKSRPLPAPPRPSRKSKSEILKNEINKLDQTNDTEKNEDEVIVTQQINIQITPPRELTEILNTTITTKSVSEIKKDNVEAKEESEKKEGPFAAIKEIISQKKKEFFEPRKEIIKTESIVTKTDDKKDLVTIIPLKSEEETEMKVEEANVYTQTDPLPEGYVVEDEHQTEKCETKFNSLGRSEPTASQAPRSIFSQNIPKTHSKPHKTENIETPKPEQSSNVKEIHTVIEKRVIVTPDEDTEVSFLKAQKLQVSELDVDKLNVNEIQAKKISVSDIDGVAMEISELSSKSGNLVLNGVELPPEFLQNLVSTITSSSSSPNSAPHHEHIQVSTQTSPTSEETEPILVVPNNELGQQKTQTQQIVPSPPVVVYPSQTPIIVYPPQTNSDGQSTIAVHPAIIPQIFSAENVQSSIPRTRSPPRNISEDPSKLDDSEDQKSLMAVPVKRHNRQHHSQSSLNLSNDENDVAGHTSLALQHPVTSRQLICQLLQIWQSSIQDGVFSIIEGINRAFPEGEKRKDAQTAVCIILILIAVLTVIGFGTADKEVHHHHWDFQFPPPR